MGFRVIIEKLGERGDVVLYRFWDFPEKVGVFSIGKMNGEIALVEAMPGDSGNAHFTRAVVKVLQHWRKGELPDRTSFCS